MFVVTRPVSRTYNHVQDEVLELRCAVCRRRFDKLADAYLAYIPPEPRTRSEATWVHRTCGERTTTEARPPRLLRADVGLQRLLASLLTPAVPLAALQDLPRRISRPWGSP